MNQIESSIIIPLHGNWPITKACLEALASTLKGENTEIITVDNASADETPTACPATGKTLFGDSFHYIRNESNRNFAGATNQGAHMARGRFLIFLNNDTEPQPGWLRPLIDDFKTYSDIAATGPLLVYPENGSLGLSIQHLGVMVNPWMRLGHLYQGIPYTALITKNRRFFQIISAACMAIPKAVFLGAGCFDENFINGFEDVDLCARLWSKGLRFTVNPQSLVLHHESLTPGRNAHELDNSIRLANGSLRHVAPDWHIHVKNDGMRLILNKWGMLRPGYSSKQTGELNQSIREMRRDGLESILRAYPYLESGWHRLLRTVRDAQERIRIFNKLFKIFPTPENAIAGCNLALGLKMPEIWNKCFSFIKKSAASPEELRQNIQENQTYMSAIGLHEISGQYDLWLQNYERFISTDYRQFRAACLKLAKRIDAPISHDSPQK